MAAVLHSALLRGALSGWAAAAVVDLHAFLQWKSVDDARTYNYRIMLLRWAQGLVSGALVGAGVNAVA